MNDLHHKYLTEYGNNTQNFLKVYKENPLVQDCTPYPGYKFCMIEEMERLGNIGNYYFIYICNIIYF